MSRKMGWIEAGAMAAMPGACATPKATNPYGENVPDGVDYLMAVQCSGLPSAYYWLGAANPVDAFSNDHIFKAWARARVEQGGRDSVRADTDIAASRIDFLRLSGNGEKAERANALVSAHGVDIDTCLAVGATADFDVISIGG